MSVQPVITGDSPKKMLDSPRSSVTVQQDSPMQLGRQQSLVEPNNQSVKESSDPYKALEDLIEAISAKIPCNQNSPVNQKHMRSFQKVMEKYFKNLETAFPYQKIEKIYNRYVTEE